MEKTMDRAITWFGTLFMAYAAAYLDNANAVGYALILASGLVVSDYITGISASLYEGQKLISRRMRWGFAKLVVYVVSITGTLSTGVLLHLIERFIHPDVERTDVLMFTLIFVKFEAYVIAWVETVSILENFRRVFPRNLFLKYLHWFLSVEVVKKIPKLTEFLKEKDKKAKEDENNK